MTSSVHSTNDELNRRLEQLQLLLEVNNGVTSHLDLRELFRAISTYLRRVINHDAAGITLYDSESDELRILVLESRLTGETAIVEGRMMPLEDTPGGVVFKTRETKIFNLGELSQSESPLVKQVVADGVKSGCIAPLIVHGRVLGTLDVASLRDNAFSARDAEVLEQIAGQVAIAIQNALNFERAITAQEQLARERDRSQLLLEINNAVASSLDLRELFHAVSGSLRQIFQHDFAVMGLYNDEKMELRVYALDDASGFSFLEEGMVVPLDGTPAGHAVTTRRPIIVGISEIRKFTAENIKRAVEQGLRSSCSVPLIHRNRVIGAMSIASRRDDVFEKSDAELLMQIAGQIAIAVDNALAYREIESLKNKLASEKLYLEDEIRTEHNFEELIGASPAFKRILKQIENVAPTDAAVLIRGETGAGKELIARAIHSLSDRRERTLVKLNCAAIPTGLLESELFGHEKGAFTGAIAHRVGRFELAHKGTLFLDEVGDIPLELQPKLLRVLQEQEFERLGSTRTQKVDVRLIAATNCDLEAMVAEKRYRSDLYYRLNVVPITIPPLRERTDDIPTLARFFTQKYARRLKKRIETISAEAMAALTKYHWPGNVRELEHFIERAVVLTRGADLEVPITELKLSAPATATNLSTLEDAERDHILRALEETDWVIGGPNGAAARLGMKRTTLQSKMQKLGISRQRL